MKPRPRVTIVNFVLVLGFAGFGAMGHFAMAQSLDKPPAAVPATGVSPASGVNPASGVSPAKEKVLLAALGEAAQWKPLDPRVAKAHEDLADFYSAEGRYADAEKIYQKTLELKEDMLGRANPAIIPAVDDVARVSFAQMKYDQAADLIAREFGVSYHHDHIGVILREMGFTHQKPTRRAKERDEARIDAWRREVWPAFLKKVLTKTESS